MQPLLRVIPMAPGQDQGWMWRNASPSIVGSLLPEAWCHMGLHTFPFHTQ